MRVDTGDTELRYHLETSACNARYICKMSQNQHKEVPTGCTCPASNGWHRIEGDKVTDKSSWEQLDLIIHSGKPTEKLVECIEHGTCAGAAISSAIVTALTNMALDTHTVHMC